MNKIKNIIYCPLCHSPYFLEKDRYKNFTGNDLPENTYRLCMACGYEVKFESQENDIEKI